jgi:hypothetical protein
MRAMSAFGPSETSWDVRVGSEIGAITDIGLHPIIAIIGSYESDNPTPIPSILAPDKHRSSEAGRRERINLQGLMCLTITCMKNQRKKLLAALI